MRITELVKTAIINLTDELVLDNPTGTKAITFENLLDAINQKIGYAALYGSNIPVEARRNIWRGKNLGSTVTSEQYEVISNGTFKGLYLGDYWIINDYTWRIVDFDYWLGTGDALCETHHVVIMPDECLLSARMNVTASTEGGYYNSELKQQVMPTSIRPIIESAFSSEHLLTHRDYFTTGITDGVPSTNSWFNSVFELPNEVMMFGCHILAQMSGSGTVSRLLTTCKVQLAAARINLNMIVSPRKMYWLRDIGSAYGFCTVGGSGAPGVSNANLVSGNIRPVFGITG